jgi:hypothetical protein
LHGVSLPIGGEWNNEITPKIPVYLKATLRIGLTTVDAFLMVNQRTYSGK